MECEQEVGGRVSTERRNFIRSIPPGAQAVRQHWQIEKGLHQGLDTAFAEDQMRLRTESATENFSRINGFALSRLKQENTNKLGIRNKRLWAG